MYDQEMTVNIYVRSVAGESNFTPLSVLGIAQAVAPVLRNKASRVTGPRSSGKYFWIDNGSYKKAVIFVADEIDWDDRIIPTVLSPMRVMVEMKTEPDEVALVIGLVSILRLIGGREISIREVGDDGVLGTFISLDEYIDAHGVGTRGLELLKLGSEL